MSTPVRVTISPEDRWEQGIDHDARSEELFGFMKSYDLKFNGGSLDLRSGGDGDAGEELMYLMDEYFASKDKGATDG